MMEFKMYHSGKAGQQFNTNYRNEVTIKNAEDLRKVCRFDHVCVEFANDFHRCNDDFLRCYAIAGDCDNDSKRVPDPAAWLTPEKISERIPGVFFYACASRNNNKTKHPGELGEEGPRPRYHYYFPLREPVTDFAQAKNIMDKLLVLFPEFDENGTKPAQFFYGHDNPETTMIDGVMDLAAYFNGHPDIKVTEKPQNKKEAAERPERVQAAGDDEGEFVRLNIADWLAAIPADDYGEWVRVGMAIKAAGEDVSLWDDWSQKSNKYPGYNAIVKKWNSFKGQAVGPGTLYHLAKKYGWIADPRKYTGKAKRLYEKISYEEEQRKKFQEEHREEHAAALKSLGIDCAGDPYRYTWNYDFDGSIDSVWTEEADEETGEIKKVYHYKKRAAGDSIQPDSEQPIPGETVHTGPGAKQPKKEKPLEVTGYDDIEIKETDYLFFPWFPRGKLVAIQGDSGSSKSTFAYSIGAHVTTGKDILGVPCEDPGNVMFITNEDDESDILTAFLDAGGDMSRLFRVKEREQIARLDLSPAGAETINKIIKDNNIRLLVLDPIQAFLRGDMNKANETRPQLARLMDIAAENNNCIAFIEHTGKDTTKAALHRGIGSVDIGAATRSIIQIVTDPADDFYKIAYTVKNNTAALQDTRRAIRYQVKDRPGSRDQETGKHHHFHGHAEFSEILPEYNERTYRRAQRNAEEDSLQAEIDYATDPLVITVRKLIGYNPGGLFIGTTELIRRITICAGHCPYVQTQNKHFGINSRISVLRGLMMDNDAIQMDLEKDPTTTKPFHWNGEIITPEKTRERGVYINPIRNGSSDSQQTEL